jgi:hypothetical protein
MDDIYAIMEDIEDSGKKLSEHIQNFNTSIRKEDIIINTIKKKVSADHNNNKKI